MRDWLIELRKQKKLSQQELAEKVGITRQMISAIENGDATPSVPKAQTISKLLGCEWTKFYEKEAV